MHRDCAPLRDARMRSGLSSQRAAPRMRALRCSWRVPHSPGIPSDSFPRRRKSIALKLSKLRCPPCRSFDGLDDQVSRETFVLLYQAIATSVSRETSGWTRKAAAIGFGDVVLAQGDGSMDEARFFLGSVKAKMIRRGCGRLGRFAIGTRSALRRRIDLTDASCFDGGGLLMRDACRLGRALALL